MSDFTMRMTCDDFAARLGDYLEDDAPEAVREAMTAHAAECASCGELLADLVALPVQAAALPLLEPSRDLWAGIAERIDARVIPLDVPRVAAARRGWMRPAAAAAALVIATAGITYQVTRTVLVTRTASVAVATPNADTMRPVQMVASAPVAPTVESSIEEKHSQSQSQSSSKSPSQSPRAAVRPARPTTRLASAERPSTGAPRTTGVRLVSADPLKDVEPVYDQEITKLRIIVRQRRNQLDPATVAVLEQSIAVIDSAIAQSRAALAKDPASGFLATQLNHSLEKKVELLRTAALLPSRT